ncbi:hypothetical protein ACVIW2_007102 [Bradyrhizobium huanghuaihaiense]
MTDSSAGESARRSETIEVLRQLAQKPQRRAGLSTETVEQIFPSGLSQRTTGTDLVDVRAFAETIMFDATALVSRLEQMEHRADLALDEDRDKVSVASVLQGGAAVAASFAGVCLVGNHFSSTLLIHPLLGWLLIFSSIGFFAMGKVRP